MSEAIDQAKDSYKRWLRGFNARDQDAMVAELHFPHLRLSGRNEVQVWKTADEINIDFEGHTQSLQEEGWVSTESSFIDAIQSGPDKVHLTMIQSRMHSTGKEYNRFHTLWIFIRENGRWGVKFRSSFLVNAAEHLNFDTL